MKQLSLTLLLVASLFCFSCSSSDDGDTTQQSTINPGLEGSWEGSFSGTDSGTWTMVIDASGKVTGTTFSKQFGNLVIAGTVSGNGSLSATAGVASSGATFKGTFKDGKGDGTWSNTSQSLNGFWIGTKK